MSNKVVSAKRPYQSKHGGGNITAAQYIIEIICTKKAIVEKKSLPRKFWLHASWQAFFKRWLKITHQMLKKYEPLAIINALQDSKSGLRYSLSSPSFEKLIQEHQKRLNTPKEQKLTEEEINIVEQLGKKGEGVRRQPLLKPGLMEKLDEV